MISFSKFRLCVISLGLFIFCAPSISAITYSELQRQRGWRKPLVDLNQKLNKRVDSLKTSQGMFISMIDELKGGSRQSQGDSQSKELIEDLTTQLDVATGKIAKFQGYIDNLNSQLKVSEKKIKELQKRDGQFQEEINKLNLQSNAYLNEIKAFEEKMAQSHKKVDDLEKELERVIRWNPKLSSTKRTIKNLLIGFGAGALVIGGICYFLFRKVNNDDIAIEIEVDGFGLPEKNILLDRIAGLEGENAALEVFVENLHGEKALLEDQLSEKVPATLFSIRGPVLSARETCDAGEVQGMEPQKFFPVPTEDN